MRQKLKIIYTILVLIKNVLIRKTKYKLSFFSEYDNTLHKTRWYYDFKHWGFNKENLEMVSGADALCTKYAFGNNYLTVEILTSKKLIENEKTIDYDMYVGEDFSNLSFSDKLFYGRNYTNVTINEHNQHVIKTMWICPVTLFVLGRYPNYIYIKKIK